MQIQRWKEKFEIEMRLKNMRPNSIDCYSSFLDKFLRHFNMAEDPQHISIAEIKFYLSELGKISLTQQKQSRAALKLFYSSVVKQKKKFSSIPFPKIISKLPAIIDKYELLKRIRTVRDARSRAIFVLLYGTGLRVSEIAKLRVSNFNKERKEIIVRLGKGGKDRIVPYTDSIRQELIPYFAQRKNSQWFFHGENPQHYISPSTIEKQCRMYLGAHPHQLRHCFAVNFIESGGSIYVLKNILGHNNIKTTERYLRLTRSMLNTPNPIDELRAA